MKYLPSLLSGALLVGASTSLFGAVDSAANGASPEFRGKIGLTAKDSTPDWRQSPTTLADAPNIILVLLDDVGFGSSSTFGGPAETPALDKLAADGLRYNRFHVTALCSPTRAALLSGRNHHRVGFGTVAEGATGYPGYDSVWRKENVSLPEVLRRNGYNTAAFGKWHNTPQWEVGPDGPFDHWPTSLGFEYWYGFQLGEASQFETPLYRNTTPVEPSRSPAQGYHFTTDIVDDAIRWVHTHEATSPNKPYFLYLATGAAHAPLHVPAEWVAKYRGKFDGGWDKLREETFARQKKLGVIPADAELTPRPKELPAWDSLPADRKRLYARQMEAYAAFLAHTDHEIGRLLEDIRHGPKGENTLVLYIVGDNGASAEGGIEGTNDFATFLRVSPITADEYLKHVDEIGGVEHDNHYPSAWAWANNAPFQWTKQIASHLGGIRDPLVVSWPARIKDKGGLRSQFSHVNDIAPTLYDLLGIKFPDQVDGVKQQPLDGQSFAASFEDSKAPSHHTVQYFEMVGNRSIYRDGWLASARHSVPWDFASRTNDYAGDKWELYNLNEDYSQARDLASQYPEKLKELQALFDQEARANNVYPLAALLDPKTLTGADRPNPLAGKTEFTYEASTPRLPNAVVPVLVGSHRITAQVEIPDGGAEGVLIADGARYGGFTLYLKNGQLVYENNFYGRIREVITSKIPIPNGKVELVYDYTRENPAPWGGGTGRLFINGQLAGEGKLTRVGAPSYLGTFGVGRQYGSPVSPEYEVPFNFTGTLVKVVVQLTPAKRTVKTAAVEVR